MVIANTLTKSIVMICLMAVSTQGYAMKLLEDAIETDSLRITLKENNTGYVQGKICDDCKLLTVAITPETKAFNNDIEVPLAEAAARSGKYATIFINTEHTQVTRIVW